MSIDISNLAEENHSYAVHLATLQNIIIYKNSKYKLANFYQTSAFETVDFWRNISLAAEILLKASLLKHQVPFIKKREYSEYGEKVTSLHNQWLNQLLKDLKINYLAQINTGTVNTALKSAQNELFDKISLSDVKIQLIEKMFYLIIRTRRNRNNHFFFTNQSHMDIAEIEMVFLPLLNMLEEIYLLEKS